MPNIWNSNLKWNLLHSLSLAHVLVWSCSLSVVSQSITSRASCLYLNQQIELTSTLPFSMLHRIAIASLLWSLSKCMYHVQGRHGKFLAGKTITAATTSLAYCHCRHQVLFKISGKVEVLPVLPPSWRPLCSAWLRTMHIVLNTQTLFLVYQGHLKRRHSGVWPALWRSVLLAKIYYVGSEYWMEMRNEK